MSYNAKSIKLLFTGDICPINRVENKILDGNIASLTSDVIDIFNNTDLNVVDLECPLTLSNDGRPKTGPYQKAHPKSVNILTHLKVGLVAMANNHIMDFGEKGVMDTIDICRQNKIEIIGVGASEEEARTPYSMQIKDKSIAILNYGDNEFLTAPSSTMVCNPIDNINLFYDIRKAKRNSMIVILIMHAGNEFYDLPSPRTKKLYRSIIDMGADCIISHHTHAFSGFEIYNSKPIFYGLGNFLYDWPGKVNSSWNQGYMVKLVIEDKIDFEIIPLKQNNELPGVFRLNESERQEFDVKINRLNEIILNDEHLEQEFQNYCNSVFPMYNAFIEPAFGKYIASLRKRGLFPNFLSRRKRLLLLNLVRCESHRDVLLRFLKRYE